MYGFQWIWYWHLFSSSEQDRVSRALQCVSCFMNECWEWPWCQCSQWKPHTPRCWKSLTIPPRSPSSRIPRTRASIRPAPPHRTAPVTEEPAPASLLTPEDPLPPLVSLSLPSSSLFLPRFFTHHSKTGMNNPCHIKNCSSKGRKRRLARWLARARTHALGRSRRVCRVMEAELRGAWDRSSVVPRASRRLSLSPRTAEAQVGMFCFCLQSSLLKLQALEGDSSPSSDPSPEDSAPTLGFRDESQHPSCNGVGEEKSLLVDACEWCWMNERTNDAVKMCCGFAHSSVWRRWLLFLGTCESVGFMLGSINNAGRVMTGGSSRFHLTASSRLYISHGRNLSNTIKLKWFWCCGVYSCIIFPSGGSSSHELYDAFICHLTSLSFRPYTLLHRYKHTFIWDKCSCNVLLVVLQYILLSNAISFMDIIHRHKLHPYISHTYFSSGTVCFMFVCKSLVFNN